MDFNLYQEKAHETANYPSVTKELGDVLWFVAE